MSIICRFRCIVWTRSFGTFYGIVEGLFIAVSYELFVWIRAFRDLVALLLVKDG